MAIAELRIVPTGDMPNEFALFLNDEDISRYVRGFTISMKAGNGVPLVSLDLLATLDIPDNIAVIAHGVQDGDR